MTKRCVVSNRAVAFATALSLILTPAAPLLAAPAPTQAATPAPAPAKTPAAAAAPVDGGWPRAYTTPSGGQILRLPAAGRELGEPAAHGRLRRGRLRGEGRDEARARQPQDRGRHEGVGRRTGSSTSRRLQDHRVQLPDAQEGADARGRGRDRQGDPGRGARASRSTACWRSVDKSQIIPKNVEGVKADPPTIFFSKTPAVLVNLDGEPIWSPIKENDLKFAVNTNWDLFQHGPTKTLLPAQRASLAEGDGRRRGRGRPPASCRRASRKLPADDNWKDVKAALPGQEARRGQGAEGVRQHDARGADPAERARRSTSPSRTRSCSGSATRRATCSAWADTGAVYYLVAGRWFTAPDFTGPWTFATPSLPEDFQKIPLEHPRSRVLASVPGTQQAAEAVLLAQVPQTARVNKKELKAPEVAYQGEPEVRADREDHGRSAPSTPTRTSSRSATSTTCASRACGSCRRAPTGPWEVDGDGARRRSTRSRPARPPTTSRT